MAIEYLDNKIILTGDTARNFVDKMQNPDVEVIKKRDKWLKECRENLEIIKEDGSVRLVSK